jgi:amino-acid N-acetyltransferase
VIAIERAQADDRAAIEDLLAANDLPREGLELAAATAVVARDEGGAQGIVGSAAIEPYGSVGLLRSVCVAPHLRGTGLGRRLVAEAEAVAASNGVDELFLLTETAGEWFPRLGYERVPRETAPALLKASPEFTTACPESAQLFRKRI